jgi:hypothetical protein
LSAANYLYNVSAKDGSELGAIDAKAFTAGAFRESTAQFDLNKFGWLGSVVDGREEPYVLWTKTGLSPLVSGSEGGLQINHAKLANNVLRWDVKHIAGYPDPAQVRLAFEKNEINLVSFSITGVRTNTPHWFRDPSFLPLIQYGSGVKRHKDLAFVPTLAEFAASNEDKQLISSFERLFVLGRAFAAPPSIPEHRLIQLRALFERTVTDQEYREEAAKIGVIVSPVSWREAEEIVKDISRIPPDTVAKLKSF